MGQQGRDGRTGGAVLVVRAVWWGGGGSRGRTAVFPVPGLASSTTAHVLQVFRSLRTLLF